MHQIYSKKLLRDFKEGKKKCKMRQKSSPVWISFKNVQTSIKYPEYLVEINPYIAPKEKEKTINKDGDKATEVKEKILIYSDYMSFMSMFFHRNYKFAGSVSTALETITLNRS